MTSSRVFAAAIGLAGCLGLLQAVYAQGFGPAPKGDARTVARQAIDAAPHPCPKVVSARRLNDGSIHAECSNGEDYRIVSGRGEALAMRCKAVRALGVAGC